MGQETRCVEQGRSGSPGDVTPTANVRLSTSHSLVSAQADEDSRR